MMNNDTKTVFLSIGSNLGDRKKNIDKAIEQISNLCGAIQQFSSIYETQPWGYISENNYLNCCLEIQTNETPVQLLNILKLIERSMGRVSAQQYEDRIIDIDILFYGSDIIEREELIIPHPKIQQRAFVLIPLYEIAPKWIHPKLFLTISQLFSSLSYEKEIKICKFAV